MTVLAVDYHPSRGVGGAIAKLISGKEGKCKAKLMHLHPYLDVSLGAENVLFFRTPSPKP